jgi:hypothetical protein
VRSGELSGDTLDRVDRLVDTAEQLADRGQPRAAKAVLRALAITLRGPQYATLVSALRDLADSL